MLYLLPYNYYFLIVLYLIYDLSAVKRCDAIGIFN